MVKNRVLEIPEKPAHEREPMTTFYGAQFRAARAALGLKTREIAEGATMSMLTLHAIEQAGVIRLSDTRTRGHPRRSLREVDRRGDDAAVERLVDFYRRRGVAFLANTAQGPGLRFR